MKIVEQLAAARTEARMPTTRIATLVGTAPSNIYAIEHGRRDPTAST